MFIEFHLRSAFSFLEGASVPEDLATACAEGGMPAAALLDRNGVYGAPRFHQAMSKLKLKAHIGAEIDIESPLGGVLESTVRLPLLAVSRTGYRNLCRLITRTKLRVEKHAPSFATLAELEEFAPGLICLTGGEDGPLSQALALKGIGEARQVVDRLAAIYGHSNVYVELQRHFTRIEEVRNQAAIEIAESLRLPLLATNAPQYARPEQRALLDVLTCVRGHTTLDECGRRLQLNSERFVKPGQIMQQLFADLPSAIANTAELSSRLEFTLADLGYEFPHYPVGDGETMMSFLRKRTTEGFANRYGSSDAALYQRAQRQVERELVLIEKLRLPGYFLIVWDIVRFCREQNILVQGRGSAANSAVCYSLGITAVDPVGMDLLFERFLSEERGEWPDIDLDLPSGNQRERAIQYVYQRYGPLGAAMTANVITYRGRLAAREMGKAMGFDGETLSRLSAMAGHWEYRDPNYTMERQFREAGLDLRHPRLRRFLELCLAVQDLPRHLGQHSGGMVVCQGQLDSVVPLEPASMPGRVVVQWDKDDCADLGIVKVDLLGLGMMATLEDSLQLIHDHYGEDVDLAHLPAGDPAVYQALQAADTVGMFQIESRAQMSCLPRLRPERFYDIVVQVAIIRPGPIVGKMVHPYLKRRQGRETVVYPHPALEPVLERTLGVPLFQEQLLRMAMITAGFTGGEAEELRRALGFKRSEKRMGEIEVKLRAGMQRNGIAGEAQEAIVSSITAFALYGFPESHSASFALLAYASAYLKTHYLAAFTAALLNNQPMGFYSPATVVKDAQRHGLKLLPLDVTRSEWKCTLEPVAPASRVVNGRCSAGLQAGCPPPQRAQEQRVPGTPAGSVHAGSMLGRGPGGPRDSRALTPPSQNQAWQGPRSGDRRYILRVSTPSHSVTKAQNDEQLQSREQVPSEDVTLAVRLGLCYAKGLRAEAAQALLQARRCVPFRSIDDLALRVPELRKSELALLADIGALNKICANRAIAESGNCGTENRFFPKLPDYPITQLPDPRIRPHRRDALWQVECAARRPGPLLEGIVEQDEASPLARMSDEERLVADFRGTGMTVGPHPMAYCRAEMNRLGIFSASELPQLPNGRRVRTAGAVIARQRPGTASGFVFLSLEDETGIANAIVTPDLFEEHRLTLVSEQFLLIEGVLQNQDHVVSVKADRIAPLHVTAASASSHDFH